MKFYRRILSLLTQLVPPYVLPPLYERGGSFGEADKILGAFAYSSNCQNPSEGGTVG